MNDSESTEPPFEILIPSTEQTRVAALRPDRWLYVTHLLVLLSIAALAVCIVGLIRATRSSDGSPGAGSAIGRSAMAEASAATLVEPAVLRVPDSVPPAPGPSSGAEGAAPAGASPGAAPPAPSEPVAAEPEPEPPPPPAPKEESGVARLLEEARSAESDQPALAAARYRKAIELAPDRTELWKAVADLDLARGAVEDASRAYREFLRSHPDRADALQNLAILELRSGRIDEARGLLERGIKAAPSADLYFNLGNLQLKAVNVEPAVAAYRRALEYQPRHAEARFNLALALERAGRRAEAVAALAQLGSVSPEVVRERARMEAAMGGVEAARALDLARGSGDVEMILGVASGFRQAGELEKALAILDRAVELAPRNATVRLNRGAVRQAMGRAPDAARDYEEAAALDPSLAEARFNLGVLAEERGQYVGALNHYAAALKANSGMACALNNVGALYLKVGQPEKAVEWFRRCGAADSSFTSARLNLAWAYLALGSRDLALTELKAYAQDVPKEKRSPDAVRVLGELEAPGPAVRR